MKKIPSLFKRDYEGTRLVYDELVEGTEWVAAGEGIATAKYDGTACLVRGGKLYARYELKRGKTAPQGFTPAQQDPDSVTGDIPGWIPVGEGPEHKWHREAWADYLSDKMRTPKDWTYELLGPKVQGNPHECAYHLLFAHGATILADAPRDFEGIKQYLAVNPMYEGIVWWRNPENPDCDKVKIKRRDFGFPWPPKK